MSLKDKLSKRKEQRASRRSKLTDFDLSTFCGDHTKQYAFVTDNSERTAASCSRRAGKSEGECGKLIQKARSRKDSLVYYICNTIGQADEIMWDRLLDKLFEYYEKPQLRINNTKHEVRLPTGGIIRLAGCPDIASVRRFLGLAYTHVTIDECQDFNGLLLDRLIRKAIEPALLDHAGTLSLIGTPALIHTGPFYEAYHNKGDYKGYSRHHWTSKDNPHLWRKRSEATGKNETFDMYIAAKLARNDIEVASPVMMREDFGQWVQGDDELVYWGYSNDCVYEELPKKIQRWHHVIGVDLGSKDATGITVGAYSFNHPTLYVVEDFKKSRMDITSLANTITEFVNKYQPDMVVIDPAAGGANWVDELNNRYGIPCMAAEKLDKEYWIKTFNSLLKDGHLKVLEDSQLIDEWTKLGWRISTQTGKRLEDKSQDNHLADACLYMARYTYQYAWELKEDPKPHEDGWEDYEEERTEKEIKQSIADEKYWDAYEHEEF